MKTEDILNGLELAIRESLQGREHNMVYTKDSVENVIQLLVLKIRRLEEENKKYKEQERKLETPIAELRDPLTNKKVTLKMVNKLFFRAECNTLGDIVALGRNKLKMIPSIGPTTIKELDRVMRAYGYINY